MSQSIWDTPDLMVGGEYVSFENIGDTVSGVINAMRVQRFPDTGTVAPQLLLTTDEGEDKTVTAGQVGLKIKLGELRPVEGDHIKITLTNIEKRSGGKTLKHWAVEVTPNYAANATPPTVPAATPANSPAMTPQQAQQALAGLTPEMRAALGQLSQ